MDSNSQNKGVIEETIVPTVSENKNLVKVEEKEDVVDEKPIDVENNEDIVQEIPDNDLTTEEIPSPSIEKEDEEIIAIFFYESRRFLCKESRFSVLLRKARRFSPTERVAAGR